ncbi:hypothetical protein [Desulfovibrio ferrophilus]|uniref:Uncharacterized protein n=1 Tax=Desulfovibrio ferrophilus TaxID=241368 RepID=A0A2Z6AVN7_9BACT|nr:hypothetical protein [Desulfovibrio ferrophilus]BBD07280.1 hypothetical protein DFE_0554 [Desulfovibrio ferrophilus]
MQNSTIAGLSVEAALAVPLPPPLKHAKTSIAKRMVNLGLQILATFKNRSHS